MICATLGCYNPPSLWSIVLYLILLFFQIHGYITDSLDVLITLSLFLLGLAVTESISLIVETGYSIRGWDLIISLADSNFMFKDSRIQVS